MEGGIELQSLIERVKRYSRDVLKMRPGKSWILGVSGGPDSMVLLDVFHRLQEILDLSLAVVHVNHGLRKEADLEQSFVEKQAKMRGLQCIVYRKNVRALKKKGQSLEECARVVRYACLEQARSTMNAEGILVAHHQNDVAETVLLHLVRGTGLNGLKGIQPVRNRIFRPLLTLRREEIMLYLKENGIPYCEDASNSDTYYTRNRIRGILLPLLQEAFNPQIVTALNRLADLAGEDEKALQAWTEVLWPKICREQSPERLILWAPELLRLPVGMQRRMVRKALTVMRGESGWTARDVEDVLRLAEKSGSNHRVILKKQLICRKVYQEIQFDWDEPSDSEPFCLPVDVPGSFFIEQNGKSYQLTLWNWEQIAPDRPGLFLDAQRLPEKLCLRSRRPGDVFHPAGAPGGKKLKSWMIDRKIPVSVRETTALLSGMDGTIYAVAGWAASEMAAVSEETKTVLLLEEKE